jgi:hypothetical protein
VNCAAHLRARTSWRARHVTLLAAGLALALSGCGGGSDVAAEAPPVPEDCVASWNGESASLQFGQHVFKTHGSARAQIDLVEPEQGAINIKGEEACAVVFSVPENDYEYGDVGLVVTTFGWASMRELAPGDNGGLIELQDTAAAAPNATLFPDGTLEAD